MDKTQSEMLTWRKARRSSADGGDCVEVADLSGGGRAVRDSKDPGGPVLRFTSKEWGAFVAGVKADEFG
ncbi:DUF397 domain-containing protein [Streptosporangium sp. NBC_01755]|uniref:DUF397 domain-containing protein n=1 Tax=unclassified Streptosporangium TaxID=2632669 RepID=UPI002DDA1925|nr:MULTISPECIES: DUF397 domain-containing protein [unclassified Streptosporangium]WSA24553.1 DUF397 domain-containing protein [Streptosporangium sp. NBC_01810]WSC97372.1 DUF397 domain-containing protein [Streptosporangium sp. NBC_01755]